MKQKKRQKSLWKTIIIGAGIGIVLSFILAMLIAKLCDSGVLKEKMITAGAITAEGIATFVSTMYAGRTAGKMKFPIALSVGGIELVLCLVFHAAMLQSGYQHVLIVGIVIIISSCVAGILSVSKKPKHKFA